jgi:L-ascorbate 6-phosphate lactonase
MQSQAILKFLGQVGFFLDFDSCRLLIDPYISNSVADQFGSSLARCSPLPFLPASTPNCDALLLTHAHLDHTDPATLGPLIKAQPHLRIFAPYESRQILSKMGQDRTELPPLAWTNLFPELSIRAIPSAHTEIYRNANGELRDVGYLIQCGKATIYHAGDTIPHPEIFESLQGEAIDYALLPVNERNYYRESQGIIGNMTLREAFQMATDLQVKTFIPTHWDMFAPNSAFPEEIELLHTLLKPPFQLKILLPGETLHL